MSAWRWRKKGEAQKGSDKGCCWHIVLSIQLSSGFRGTVGRPVPRKRWLPLWNALSHHSLTYYPTHYALVPPALFNPHCQLPYSSPFYPYNRTSDVGKSMRHIIVRQDLGYGNPLSHSSGTIIAWSKDCCNLFLWGCRLLCLHYMQTFFLRAFSTLWCQITDLTMYFFPQFKIRDMEFFFLI